MTTFACTQKTHLLAGGMAWGCNPHQRLFPADVLHRRKIAPQFAAGFFTASLSQQKTTFAVTSPKDIRSCSAVPTRYAELPIP
jgi:hypothetical protein